MAFTGILTPNPLQFIRQFAAAPYVDMVFSTTAERNAYLTNVRRYAGMIVVDLEENSAIYTLNPTADAWVPAIGIKTLTGLNIDNTDPLNPIIKISVDGTTITGDGTPGNPLVATQTAQVQSDWLQSNSASVDYIKNKPTIPAAQVNSDWNSISGVSQILNKPDLSVYATITYVDAADATKVDKVPGKQLSTEDFTTAEKTKLDNLALVATTGNYNDLTNLPTIPPPDRFGVSTEDASANEIRSFNSNGFDFTIQNATNLYLNVQNNTTVAKGSDVKLQTSDTYSLASLSSFYDGVVTGIRIENSASSKNVSIFSQDNTNENAITVTPSAFLVTKNATDYNLPISVNGNYADANGNINVSITSSGLTLKTNSVDNVDQVILDLINSSTVQFQYLGNGQVTAKSLSPLNNGLVSTGGISLSGNVVTITHPIVWVYNNVTYTQNSDAIFTINAATDGYYRRDLIYADTTGVVKILTGTEDASIALTPALPANSITVTVVDIYGNSFIVSQPPSNTGTPDLQQVTDVGATTTNRININYNSGSYGLFVNTQQNAGVGARIQNSSNGTVAGAGFLLANDTINSLTIFQYSSGYQYGANSAEINSAGSGGLSIISENGKIIFKRGKRGTASPLVETASFDTTGTFKLDEYGRGNIVGTPTYNLQVDNLGNVIEAPLNTNFTLQTNGVTNPNQSILNLIDSPTIEMSYISNGTVEADVLISSQSDNGLIVLGDGLYIPKQYQDGLLSGGIITWLTGYTYNISSAVYFIGGVQYTSPSVNVTLQPADVSLDRIDAFIVDTTGVASVITGTAAVSPASPSIDPATQIELGIALVVHNTTSPYPPIAQTWIYRENVEWTTSTNASPRIVLASTNNPIAGSVSIEATNVNTADEILFTNVSQSLSAYSALIFSLEPKAPIWNKNSKINIQFFLGAAAVGNIVSIKDGVYGFSSSNLSAQYITIPLTDFNASTNIDRVQFTISETGNNHIGFYLDEIQLQASTVPTPITPSLTLTTNGTSGNATLLNNVLNVPNYTYTLPIASSTVLGGIKVGSGLSIDGNGVLNLTGSVISLTTTGTSGAATLVNNVLNIPNYEIPRFGIEDNLGLQNRSIDMQTHNFSMSNFGDLLFGSYPNVTYDTSKYLELSQYGFDTSNTIPWSADNTKGVSTRVYTTLNSDGSVSEVYSSTEAEDSAGNSTGWVSRASLTNDGTNKLVGYATYNLSTYYNSAGSYIYLHSTSTAQQIQFQKTDNSGNFLVISVPDVYTGTVQEYMPISVNGIFADSAGNITIPVNTSFPNLPEFADNDAAIAGGLQQGDLYHLPYLAIGNTYPVAWVGPSKGLKTEAGINITTESGAILFAENEI